MIKNNMTGIFETLLTMAKNEGNVTKANLYDTFISIEAETEEGKVIAFRVCMEEKENGN